jgi:hypothetical protein
MLKENMNNLNEAKQAIQKAWPIIKTECLSVFGSELHYQAMIYHLLRTEGNIPLKQLGMNVKMWIDSPVSELFQTLDKRKHQDFQGGFEPIPDVVIFKPSINGDWRRRNNHETLTNMLVAIEVKASERENSRLQPSEITLDIQKLAAHRDEVLARDSDVFPLMLVIDSAPKPEERMTESALAKSQELAIKLGIGLLYTSPNNEVYNI